MSDLAHFDFSFEDQAVRVIDRDGAPWFVLADVCRVLEIGNPSDAATRLDEDEKGVAIIDPLRNAAVGIADTSRDGGPQSCTIINESGLYSLILTSRKPAAKRFKKWVTGTVLPAIRRTGRYDIAPALPAPASSFRIPLEEVNSWHRHITLYRQVYGRHAARRLLAIAPLPRPDGSIGGDPNDVAPSIDGVECLAVLLARMAPAGKEIGALLVAAHAGDTSAAAALIQIGIQCQPAASFWLLGNSHPAVAHAFAGTEWQGKWRETIASLPGAYSAGPKRYGHLVARSTALPFALVDAAGYRLEVIAA